MTGPGSRDSVQPGFPESTFYLRYSKTLGIADEVIETTVGSWPVAGRFIFPGWVAFDDEYQAR